MPKIGTVAVCLKCDGKIVYNGEEWWHRTGSEHHKAQPKAKK